MSEDRRHPQIRHTHRWSLQKDEDFAEESHRLLSYMVAAQESIPCVHQDHPAVSAVEVMVDGMTRGLPQPMAQAMEVMAHIFFAAGQQHAIDGHVSSAYPKYEPQKDLSAPSQTMDDWWKMHQEAVPEWRQSIRDQFYAPKRTGLADLLSHLLEEHGDELSGVENSILSERDLLARLLGPQRATPETDERAAGPYL